MPRRSRFIAATLLAIALAAICLECGPARSKQERSLLIYTPHGRDLLHDFAARYRQASPDVNVQFLDMGSREILERVRTERNRPQADLWWGAAHTTFQTAAEENLLAAY